MIKGSRNQGWGDKNRVGRRRGWGELPVLHTQNQIAARNPQNRMSYPKADNRFSCSLSNRREAHTHTIWKDGKPSPCPKTLLLTE